MIDLFRPFSYLAALAVCSLAALTSPLAAEDAATDASAAAAPALHDPREIHLTELRQLTFGGENAEAYWSPDGRELIFQATVEPYACDQIFRMRPDRPAERQLVSTGKGRTTCAYFTYPGGDRILYASTHLTQEACPPRPDFSQGYVWPINPHYEIFSARPDGSDLVRLTDNEVYDAEATVCPVDGSIVFTSTRDGDLELYRMDADGSNVQRLTETPGYDGGAFFSADCSHLVWRASRPEGEALADFERLLEQDLVRPSRLEIWVARADGSDPHQVTYLESASFAPYFFPSGERILFSSNYGDPRGREFDLWAVDVDGTGLERVTYSEGFDGFPMFSPDGERLAFSSNRNQSEPGETNVFVARWVDVAPAVEPTTADRWLEAVRWLADDRREGRGVGTAGLEEAAGWLAERFAEVGLEPAAGDGDYLQAFDVPVRVEAGPATSLEIDGERVAGDGFVAASFSASGEAEGEVVAVSYGITATDGVEHDDYAGVDVRDKIVVVRRFVPELEAKGDADLERRYGDLRYKAWNAREHGAVGVIIVDLPAGEELPEEAPLPRLTVDNQSDAGLPVVIATREVASRLFAGGHRARVSVELLTEVEPSHNVIGRIASRGSGRQGAIVVGAHYDHLGLGGPGSLEPDVTAPHNGADDNASGTAVLIEMARKLGERRDELERDVYVVAFAGEETGLLGSTTFTREPPPELAIDELIAMINLDMVGRLRHNRLSVLGAASAEEWEPILSAACERAGIGCKLGGDGYGPSDQTPFYAAGVPVLHLFTGNHADYHKTTDDVDKVNAAGAARIASLVADLALELGKRPQRLTYLASPAPEPRGDSRSYGASLGTIPDYTSEAGEGVLLAGVRPESPAEAAGIERDDRLVELAGHVIGDIYDFVYVLRQAKPGERARAVVVRDGKRLELTVVFGKSRGIR